MLVLLPVLVLFVVPLVLLHEAASGCAEDPEADARTVVRSATSMESAPGAGGAYGCDCCCEDASRKRVFPVAMAVVAVDGVLVVPLRIDSNSKELTPRGGAAVEDGCETREAEGGLSK